MERLENNLFRLTGTLTRVGGHETFRKEIYGDQEGSEEAPHGKEENKSQQARGDNPAQENIEGDASDPSIWDIDTKPTKKTRGDETNMLVHSLVAMWQWQR